jgi:hypothetical protein
MAKLLQMPDIPAAPEAKATAKAAPKKATPAAKIERPTGGDRAFVTTSIRFSRQALNKLKKAAIDRGQSLQELIEIALVAELGKDGVKIPELRSN